MFCFAWGVCVVPAGSDDAKSLRRAERARKRELAAEQAREEAKSRREGLLATLQDKVGVGGGRGWGSGQAVVFVCGCELGRPHARPRARVRDGCVCHNFRSVPFLTLRAGACSGGPTSGNAGSASKRQDSQVWTAPALTTAPPVSHTCVSPPNRAPFRHSPPPRFMIMQAKLAAAERVRREREFEQQSVRDKIRMDAMKIEALADMCVGAPVVTPPCPPPPSLRLH